jgi:hypothetical protein
VVFPYYSRLSHTQKQIYRKSDRIASIPLPQPERFSKEVKALERALADEDRRHTQAAAQKLVTAILGALATKPLKVKVLERRPSHNWGELQGLYEPGRPDRITVWMRTAKRNKVVAFKTLLRTVLHELCHHLDYEFLGLAETFHTEGFFKRESSLFHQLTEPQAERKTPS